MIPVPDGIQLCAKGVCCPSCKSSLIKKMPDEVTIMPVTSADFPVSATSVNNGGALDYTALENSLESARYANYLLQAMSFDTATREKAFLEQDDCLDPFPGVPYCLKCKVHVITDAGDLTNLFDKVASEGDENTIDDTLRGRLYVAIDETDTSLLSHQNTIAQACSYDIITPSGSDDHEPPAEVDNDYPDAMTMRDSSSKTTEGPEEEACADNEKPPIRNPSIQENEGSFEVTMAKSPTAESAPTDPTYNEPEDPVALILAEARYAIQTIPTPANTERVEEAKLFLSQHLPPKKIIDDQDTHAISKDTAPLTQAESQTDISSENSGVDWEILASSGRSLLSERLKEGWVLSEENCTGDHCKNTPLVSYGEGPQLCTICRGTGNGMDGAYEHLGINEKPTIVLWDDLVSNGRAILTERLKYGWVMSSENCQGSNCRGTPLTHFQNGPLSCAVCGGCGNGFDGAYASFKSPEVIEAERALVSQEISYLMSMGWTMRDSFCEKCQMPMVAETVESEDVCILCGKNPLNELLNAPMMVDSPAICFDDNANEAGQRMMLGWRLGEGSSLCGTCGGIQMIPPNSTECGCINRACPMILKAALCSNPTMASMQVHPSETLKTVHYERQYYEQQPNSSQVTPSIGNKLSNKLCISNIVRDGLPLLVCGAGQCLDDQSALSFDEMSQMRSMTSSALGAILFRVEEAKYQLEVLQASGQSGTVEKGMKQAEVSMLMEKLASTSAALRQMEEFEV